MRKVLHYGFGAVEITRVNETYERTGQLNRKKPRGFFSADINSLFICCIISISSVRFDDFAGTNGKKKRKRAREKECEERWARGREAGPMSARVAR